VKPTRISSRDVEAMLIVAVFGTLGVVSAIIINHLYNKGIVIDELMSHFGLTSIVDVQVFTIILFLIFGIVLGALRR